MDLIELDLPRRPDGFYDLTLPFINESVVSNNPFICSQRHNGRMDLVSLDIYGKPEYKYLLCGVNNFLNEFSVKEGDVLFYPNLDDIENVRLGTNIAQEDDRAALIDAMKRASQDPARTKYLKDRKTTEALPTVIQPADRQQVEVNGDKIKLSPGFGNVPTNLNNNAGTGTGNGAGAGGNGAGGNGLGGGNLDDDLNAAGTERILVRKYYTK